MKNLRSDPIDRVKKVLKMVILKINDLKQAAYCFRIPYYGYVMPVDFKATYKMERGKEAEVDWGRLERRRTFAKYGLEDAKRHPKLWLTSGKLGLTGIMDLVIEGSQAVYPVDCKMTMGDVHFNHKIQLAGYSMLLEEKFSKPCPMGFIYLLGKNEVVEVPLEPELKEQSMKFAQDIRQSIEKEILPAATQMRSRCEECEYRNYCGDVF